MAGQVLVPIYSPSDMPMQEQVQLYSPEEVEEYAKLELFDECLKEAYNRTYASEASIAGDFVQLIPGFGYFAGLPFKIPDSYYQWKDVIQDPSSQNIIQTGIDALGYVPGPLGAIDSIFDGYAAYNGNSNIIAMAIALYKKKYPDLDLPQKYQPK